MEVEINSLVSDMLDKGVSLNAINILKKLKSDDVIASVVQDSNKIILKVFMKDKLLTSMLSEDEFYTSNKDLILMHIENMLKEEGANIFKKRYSYIEYKNAYMKEYAEIGLFYSHNSGEESYLESLSYEIKTKKELINHMRKAVNKVGSK